MNKEKIEIQLSSPERKYVRIYHDFLENSFLTSEEQMIFIVLKSYINFSYDEGEVFPSMETICKRAKLSKPRARRAINDLIRKGIIKKVQRGLTKTNLYTLADYSTMWTCENLKDLKTIIENDGKLPLTVKDHITALERMGYKVDIKERELESKSGQTTDTSTQKKQHLQEQNTTVMPKSQDLERYTLEQIKQLFGHEAMIYDNPDEQEHIDSVMDILHTTMNTTKATIKISGTDKPTMVVIGKLMKLNNESILYAIRRYKEQTIRIKNPTAYMLTILYTAPEQYKLDIANQVQHDLEG